MDAFENMRCCICGGKLEAIGEGKYRCVACSSVYSEMDIFKQAFIDEGRKVVRSEIAKALEEQRQQDIANARQNLYSELQKKNIDSEALVYYCRRIKDYLPGDFQANTFEFLDRGEEKEISEFLNSISVNDEALPHINNIVEFILKKPMPSNLLPLKNFVDRAFSGAKKIEYLTRIEDEAEKHNKGVDPHITRDAFIAYSSVDMTKVNEIVDYLEEAGLTCYVAARDLRNGSGTAESYEVSLCAAMQNCRCFVFISSHNSRTIDCDALMELRYVKDHMPTAKRIEYILESYDEQDSGLIIKELKEFFNAPGCFTFEDVYKRIKDAQ